jgi:hypothetical protein
MSTNEDMPNTILSVEAALEMLKRHPANLNRHLDAETIKRVIANRVGTKFTSATETAVSEIMSHHIKHGKLTEIGMAAAAFKALRSKAHRESPAEPPKFAELCLALFLSKARGEALIGDLSERFELDCQQFGPERARRLYWGRALRSLWPLLRRSIGRGIKLGVVVATVRKFF